VKAAIIAIHMLVDLSIWLKDRQQLHLHPFGIVFSVTLVSMYCPSCPMILVSIALGALMVSAMLASSIIILPCLLSVLHLIRGIILI
jgi:hypothetical protein